ncbi:MAG: SDR family NAD(P)-dependent oxidoreductase [Deltaproteobacteria bacterium]|nr:SDR family NAD(P)-dependent oxidoreductase [Deltaproteobacteria bacterium]
MSKELEGKVAIITGAAEGLGKRHALQLASMGASVVVNDVGGTLEGEGEDTSKAQAVVDEIEAAGGSAVTHHGDVSDWSAAEGMIQHAVDSFGGLDILINNAGIMRDQTIFNISEKDFDDVVRVHLKGHFAPTKFACNYWRAKSKAAGSPVFGRIVATSSEAFLFGSPGQPNYAAAKGGITAFTMGVAQLMLKYGVTANVVLPRARTRMTMSGPTAAIFEKPAEGFDNFDPANCIPLFAYLCTERAARVSGQVFIAWGKEIKALHSPRPLETWNTEEAWTVDAVHQALAPHYEKAEPVLDGFTMPQG